MNRKGFTLVEMIATLIVIAIVMMFIFPNAIKLQQQNDTKKYDNYEKMMAEYAEIYFKSSNTVTLTELQTKGLKGITECVGYVIINHAVTPNTYKSYIKCEDNYTTTGYTEGNA